MLDTLLVNGSAFLSFVVLNCSLSDAENVLVTGCSAGGLSTYQHTDTIAALLPSAVVKAAPVSGFFLPIDNVGGQPVYGPEMTVCWLWLGSTDDDHRACLR